MLISVKHSPQYTSCSLLSTNHIPFERSTTIYFPVIARGQTPSPFLLSCPCLPFLIEFKISCQYLSHRKTEERTKNCLVNSFSGWDLSTGPGVRFCLNHQFHVATPCAPEPFMLLSQFLGITKPCFSWVLPPTGPGALRAPAQWHGLEKAGRPRQEQAWVREELSAYLSHHSREGSLVHGILLWNGNGGTGRGREEVVNTKEEAVVISEVNEAEQGEVGDMESESGKAAGFLHTGNSAYRNKIRSSP